MKALLAEIGRCTVCAGALAHEPRPVVRAHPDARILVVGQAPGRRVHETGIPWNDPSGERLRDWMGVDREVFYSERLALVPMGFCYPGTGRSGDLPPRPECAPLWHARVRAKLPRVKLTLLLSRYAHTHYLGSRQEKTVTGTVRAWRAFVPRELPLPHPSPRNNLWLKKNPWFAAEVLPYLKRRVTRLLREA